jgi:PAS domain S-box-containing protein
VPSQNSIIDLIHPEDKAIMGRWIESAISGKKLDAVEVRVINRDGNVKFILGDGEIFFDETGKPLQAIGTAQDITERKLAEKEIQKRNEDLAFLNNINTAINRGGSLDSLTLLISKETKRIFSTNGATLHLVDPVRKCLVLKNLSMPPDLITRIEKIIGISIPRIEHDLKANHPYRQIMESGKSKIIHELHDIEEFTAGFLPAVHLSVKTQSRLRRFIPSIVKLMGYRSVLVVPLISGNEVIGTLDMGRRELFTEDDAKRLEIIAGQLTIAIQRKQAEEALRESEERYRLLAVNATDVIWTMDMNLKSTYTSPSVLRLRGYTSEEAMNQPLEKALTPGSYKAVSEMLEKELTLEKIPGNDPFRSQTLELEAIRKDGSTVWVESTMTFLRDPRGKPVEILGVTRDITGRKEADQALRESEEKMRSIFRVAPTGIGVVRDRVLLEVNPRICELTGYSQDELVGKSARVLYPTQEEFEFVGREKYEQIAQKGSGMVETRWQKKDGFIIDILLASTPIDLADLSKGVIFTALDITGRKEADQALREAHDRMLLVLDSIPANIYVADLKTYEILFMNKNMRDSFGNNLVGEVCWHVFRDGSGPCPHCSNSKLIDSQGNPTEGVTWEGQNPFTRLWYTNYDRAIRWVNGELVRLEISVDIAERKRAEEEIRQRAGELAALQATVLDLTTQHDPEDLLQSIVERAANLLKAEGGGLYLCDPEQREARCVVSYNLQRDFTGVLLKYGEGAAGTVAQTGLPLKIDDYRNWSGRASTFDEEQPFRALVSAPMLWQGRVTGVIHVLRSTSENPFTTEDQDLLALFANHAAIAFENAHLFDQVQRRLRESESLSQTSQALTGSLEIQPLLENILEAARHAIPAAEKGTIVLEEAEDTLRIRAMSGYLDGDLLNLAFNPGEGFVARVFEEQQPICLDDVQADYRIPYGGQFEEMKTVRSAIAAPLTVKGERIGVISLDNAVSTSAFTQDDMQLLVSFASSAAVAIHNARLFDQTRRRARLLTALHEISQKTSHLFDLKSIGEMTIPTIENLLGWTRGSLWLADEDANPKMLIHSTTGFKGKARQQELVRLRTLVSHPGEGIIGWVIQNGESLRSGNVLQESRYVMGNPDIRSELCVPLKMGEKTIGCINFESTSENAFSEEDEQVLSTLAGEIAGAIERARLFDQTRRRADELGALAQVSAALRIATTRAEMIPVILNQITEILHIEDAALLTYDPASGENLVELACGKWMQVTGQRISNKENYSSMLAQTGLPFQSDNISKDKRFAVMPVFRDPEAVAGLPLLVQKQYLGSLWVGRRAENDQQLPPPFMDEELRLLGSIADMTANAIHRAHLHEQTVRYADQMITVNEIGHMLSETLDLDQVYSRLTSAIQNLLPDLCGIFISLYEKRTQTIICTSAVVDGAVLDVKEIPRLPFDPEGMSRQSRVLVTSQPLIANDLAVSMVKDPRVEPGGDPMRKPESALYVPMLSKDTPIGLIQVQSYKPDCFGQEDVNLLSLVANTAAITIENARLFAETEKRLRYISALHNIDAAISASVDLRVTLSIILENVTKELSVDAAALALMNPYSKTLEYTASRGFRTRIIEGMRVRLGEGLVGQAAIQRRLVGLTETGQRELDLFGEEKFAAQFAVPLIAKGQVQGVLQVFHRSALELDMDWTNFLNTLAGQAAIAMDNASLFDNLQRSNLELTLAYDATIQGWSQAMELRDKETQGHAERVTGLTMRLASEMELSDAESVHLRRGVLLHDIGKMGIPDAILLKPGPLTPEEWEIMRMHPVYAFEMLSGISYLHQAVDVPYCHHEKWDGSGYPRGLKGEQIPLSGRLFAVVDVFDALTSDRPYRKAWSREQALGYLREQSGKHFDPQVAEVFLNMRL